jgi:hypothetical protein
MVTISDDGSAVEADLVRGELAFPGCGLAPNACSDYLTDRDRTHGHAAPRATADHAAEGVVDQCRGRERRGNLMWRSESR